METIDIKSCTECLRLKENMDSEDRLQRELAASCYVLHLAKDHGLSSFEVLKLTGVWVELY